MLKLLCALGLLVCAIKINQFYYHEWRQSLKELKELKKQLKEEEEALYKFIRGE